MQGSYFNRFRWSLGGVRQWHWISSAVCLVAMLLFAFTGITLNHAGQIEANAHTETLEDSLPSGLLRVIATPASDVAPVPAPVRRWLEQAHGLQIPDKAGEWLDAEVYLALPRPGGDAWLSVNVNTGDVIYEKTTRGAVAYLNDLHKGRNTSVAWSWFLDIFSLACVVFCLTGLVLLYRHKSHRPSTWPLVGLGVVIPLLIIVLSIH